MPWGRSRRLKFVSQRVEKQQLSTVLVHCANANFLHKLGLRRFFRFFASRFAGLIQISNSKKPNRFFEKKQAEQKNEEGRGELSQQSSAFDPPVKRSPAMARASRDPFHVVKE